MSSLKFVVSSLEAIASSKDAQRNKQLADSTTKALDAIKEQDQLPDPEIVFAPLQLASRSTNVQLTTTALDCIGKLISYSYFSVPSNPPEGTEEGAEPVPPLIERAIDTICNCFQGETTAVEIQLQIVKSLLAAVLNDKIVVHGAGLLKAVRQVYNVFLLSRSTANQQVAQGTLTQMVGTVFERVKTRLHMKEARLNLEHLKHGASNATFDQADTPNGANDSNDRDESPSEHSEAVNASTEPPESGVKLTLKDLEHRKSFDDSNLGDGPTMVTRLQPERRETGTPVSDQAGQESSPPEDGEVLDAEDEVYIRDAYLVFRSSTAIVLKSERDAAAAAGNTPAPSTGIAAGLGQALSNVGRDLQREAYMQQSEEIALRSEQLFKDLFKSQRRKAGTKYILATSFKHVSPMFNVTWMSIFSTLSSQIQKSHNLEVNKLCLEGMKLATQIACLFDLSTPREAFMSALKNTTNLNNPQEMLAKNIEALKVVLELGQTEGNVLRESWKDILMCISQLDRLQLISGGVDESAVPDVSKARFLPPQRSETSDSRSSSNSKKTTRARAGTASKGFSTEIALESRSDEVIRSVDRIFTNTATLTGESMVYFARALTEVSWDEIKVSGSNDSPRTYSLQKIVEISYYNMNRVRFEWSNIWEVFGEHFNRVGCHNNMNIVFFALDSLRQLSMRFMEIEELAGFKFQKDFLKPFEHVLANSHNVTVKDMVLRCLIQMIQARGDNIRSGWRTMFGVFTVAARDPHESIVNLAYENVNQVYKTKFGVVISQGAFTDLIVCLTEFSKNLKFQKKSLAALELLKSLIPTMLKTPECPLSQKYNNIPPPDGAIQNSEKRSRSNTSVEEGYWFPVLFAFHDVLMTGEDLEVRSNALEYFFETLLKYGGTFPSEFWDILWRQQLYPIFMVLRSRPEMSNVLNHEELSVWLSTTMIQALRNMITLFTHYFDALEYMLDRFLELLALCICQENDTISRIGSNCLQQLILKNVTKFKPEHWNKLVGAFVELFERTTAYQLFTATAINNTASISPPPNGLEFSSTASATTPMDETSLKINGKEELEDDHSVPPPSAEDELQTPTADAPHIALEEFKPSSNLQQQPVVVTAARRRFFNRIISRCVLQLLMIETVNELFSNDTVYAHIPSAELLRLMTLLKRSFQFARRFNEDKELRMRLWREGFMKQPPNLLKQESGSAATYISILFRMFADNAPERLESRPAVEDALVPLCKDIVHGYTTLEEESQHRNIVAWRPVVVDVLEGFVTFPEDAFKKHIPDFYPLAVELLTKDLTADLRSSLLLVLRRVGEVGLGIEGMTQAGQRRDSEVSRATAEPVGDREADARRML
ncbi:unnamed protein product [Fusarium fujikuroi]|nr:unnamed protein product [Fusarium fujikuroi]